MKVKELAETLHAGMVCGSGEREITGWYAGDLLSHVMGRMPEGACWFTIMNNVNVAAVAVLADAACVVLCEGVKPDDALLARAEAQGIALLTSSEDIYSAIRRLPA